MESQHFCDWHGYHFGECQGCIDAENNCFAHSSGTLPMGGQQAVKDEIVEEFLEGRILGRICTTCDTDIERMDCQHLSAQVMIRDAFKEAVSKLDELRSENALLQNKDQRIADLERQLTETQAAMFAHEAELQLPENQRILEIRRLEVENAALRAENDRTHYASWREALDQWRKINPSGTE